MTPKQAAFVVEFLLVKNATQAAIRAGYSAKTARSIGEENLTKPYIRAAVDEGLARLAGKTEITAERLLKERARLAFLDPRKLFDADGIPKPIHELDDDTAACIMGVDVLQAGDGKEAIAVVKKYRLTGKETSLAALEKHLGLNEKPIRFPLPKIGTPDDCTKAQAAVLIAVAGGEMLPGEGKVLSDLIDAQRRAYETNNLERRMAALEDAMKGQK